MIKHHIIYNVSSNWRFDLENAKGSYLYLGGGKQVIDFTSGYNIANLGWNNEEIIEAAVQQLHTNTASMMWVSEEAQRAYARVLADILPKPLDTFGRATGGMETIEEAIKVARAYTEKKQIVGFRFKYHGQSLAGISLVYPDTWTLPKSVLSSREGYIQMEYPKKSPEGESQVYSEFLHNLETVLQSGEVAAVLAEPGIITGWGSTDLLPDAFCVDVRNLTKKYGALLIFDEVGTGFSRTGTLFGMQRVNVVPDIAVFAKAMTNGVMPLGTMVTSSEIAEKVWNKTQLQSSFGWNPVACAVATKVLEIHMRDEMWRIAHDHGEILKKTLRDSLGAVKNLEYVEGLGMEIGVRFRSFENSGEALMKIRDECLEKGLHIICDGEKHIQIMPPLTIEPSVMESGVNILSEVTKKNIA